MNPAVGSGVAVLSRRCEETVIGFMRSCLLPDAMLYTYGYKMNRAVRKHGVVHEYVDHESGEYVRGDVHTNGIEGFWGILKRNLAMIGGIRHNRFSLRRRDCLALQSPGPYPRGTMRAAYAAAFWWLNTDITH